MVHQGACGADPLNRMVNRALDEWRRWPIRWRRGCVTAAIIPIRESVTTVRVFSVGMGRPMPVHARARFICEEGRKKAKAKLNSLVGADQKDCQG
jgi:hypothetical protein